MDVLREIYGLSVFVDCEEVRRQVIPFIEHSQDTAPITLLIMASRSGDDPDLIRIAFHRWVEMASEPGIPDSETMDQAMTRAMYRFSSRYIAEIALRSFARPMRVQSKRLASVSLAWDQTEVEDFIKCVRGSVRGAMTADGDAALGMSLIGLLAHHVLRIASLITAERPSKKRK